MIYYLIYAKILNRQYQTNYFNNIIILYINKYNFKDTFHNVEISHSYY